MEIAQGPLIATQRITIPATFCYVELRQRRSRDGLVYEIEHGDTRWGHRGTWGRSSAIDAAACFSAAVSYAVQAAIGRQEATR